MLRAPPGLALLLLLILAGLACAATNKSFLYYTLSTNYSRHQQSHQQKQQQQYNSPYKSSPTIITALRFPRNAATANLRTALTTTSARQSALEVLNPWLSACDLQPASATDLSADTCTTAPEAAMWTTTQCPPPCPTVSTITTTASSSRPRPGSGSSTSSRTTHASATSTQSAPNHQQQQQQQCLVYLEDTHKDEVCDLPVGSGSSKVTLAEARAKRRAKMAQFRLRHCCEHTVDSALPKVLLDGGRADGQDAESIASVKDDTRMCRQLVGALLEVDALAARVSCEFAEVLARYDCGRRYSIKHQCEDCKEVYRKWVCSSLVPHFTTEGRRIRPCLGVCQLVEERCPYMLPGDRAPAHPTQYAGEPTFLCLDQNIPETGEQRTKSSQGPADCCYNHCGSPGRGDRKVTSRSGNLCVHCPPGPDQPPPTDHVPDTITCPVTVTVNTSCGQKQHAEPPPTTTALATTTSGSRSNQAPSITFILAWMSLVLFVATDALHLLDEVMALTKCWLVARWPARPTSLALVPTDTTCVYSVVSVSRVRVVCVVRVRTCDNYYDYHDGVWVSKGRGRSWPLPQCLDLLLLHLLLDFNNTNDFLYSWTSCL